MGTFCTYHKPKDIVEGSSSIMKGDVNELERSPNLITTLDLRRLKVISALGRGAKGVVFLVEDEESTEHLAMKVILRDSIKKKMDRDDDDDGKYSKVFFEQLVLERLNHPLLPRLKGVLTTDKVVGYAIDYCPGRDLNFLRKKQIEKMFSDGSIRFYAAEMVIALEYLHNLGIVYRDLKPENIMIQENGHIMLVDFDLSTKLPPRTPKASPTITETENSNSVGAKRRFSRFHSFCNSGISPDDAVCESELSVCSVGRSESDCAEKSNSFVGTEEYVAPEIITGNGHDFAVDWWSLGIVLHEMLYGVTPFKGCNRKETFSRVLTKPAELVGEPTPLRDLIRRLLEKDPTKRIEVEEIKGHKFFKGMDWDSVIGISRPPFIPSEENNECMEGIKEIDLELFVKGIFAGDGSEGRNEVNVDDERRTSSREKKNSSSKTVRVDGLDKPVWETDNFSVF